MTLHQFRGPALENLSDSERGPLFLCIFDKSRKNNLNSQAEQAISAVIITHTPG